MRPLPWRFPFLYLLCVAVAIPAAELQITQWPPAGPLAWTNAYPNGIVTIESAPAPTGPWTPEANVFSIHPAGSLPFPSPSTNTFVRLLAVNLDPASPEAFRRLTESYGPLETIAGQGQYDTDKRNNWRPEYEGGPATRANLSRPHIAFADAANNLLVVDEGSSSVLRITPAGTIHTIAGTHVNGFNGDGPAPATNLHLYWPNGGWLSARGAFYILDTYNGRVRRLDTNGLMTTLVNTGDRIDEGRGLWVKSDESVLYFTAGTRLHRWTPGGGLETLPPRFLDLGNILGDEATGHLYLTDRDAHRVYRLSPDGTLTTLAGNGTTTGGGDGAPALQTGLNRPRGIWFLPNGSYFVCEHSPGNRIWLVDPAGLIHLWLNGDSSNLGWRGDGRWFYDQPSAPKVSKVRSVTTDQHGHLIIVENDFGFIRRIPFRRLQP